MQQLKPHSSWHKVTIITCFCILPDHEASCSCFNVEEAKDHRAATTELHNHILSFLRCYDVAALLH